jgi:hypothetical protein
VIRIEIKTLPRHAALFEPRSETGHAGRFPNIAPLREARD